MLAPRDGKPVSRLLHAYGDPQHELLYFEPAWSADGRCLAVEAESDRAAFNYQQLLVMRGKQNSTRSTGFGMATVRRCCVPASEAATSTSTTSARFNGDLRRRSRASIRFEGSTISAIPSRPSHSVPASQPSTSLATWAPA